MLKIRRSHDRLIFNMWIPISGKMVFTLRWSSGLRKTWHCKITGKLGALFSHPSATQQPLIMRQSAYYRLQWFHWGESGLRNTLDSKITKVFRVFWRAAVIFGSTEKKKIVIHFNLYLLVSCNIQLLHVLSWSNMYCTIIIVLIWSYYVYFYHVDKFTNTFLNVIFLSFK